MEAARKLSMGHIEEMESYEDLKDLRSTLLDLLGRVDETMKEMFPR